MLDVPTYSNPVSIKAYHGGTAASLVTAKPMNGQVENLPPRGAGIGGSSRSCLHEKHSVLLFFLGKRSLLVLRLASCEAVMGRAGIGGSSRSCLHEKHRILRFFLGKRSLLVLRLASCEAVMGRAGIGGSSRSLGRILAPATRLLPSRRCGRTDTLKTCRHEGGGIGQRVYDCSARRAIRAGSTTNRSGFSAHSSA